MIYLFPLLKSNNEFFIFKNTNHSNRDIRDMKLKNFNMLHTTFQTLGIPFDTRKVDDII